MVPSRLDQETKHIEEKLFCMFYYYYIFCSDAAEASRGVVFLNVLTSSVNEGVLGKLKNRIGMIPNRLD